MSYFDSINVPTTGKKLKGSYFDNIQLPKDQAAANKIYALRGEDQVNAQRTAYENSLGQTTKRTLFGLPKAALDVGKDVAKGLVEFGVSAGEAIPRLATFGAGFKDLSAKQYEPKKIPGLGFLGPVESFQNKAIRAKSEGASNLSAIGHGVFDTIVNDPVGVALKPFLLGIGLTAKTVARVSPELAKSKSLEEVLSVFKKHAPEIPKSEIDAVVAKLPTAETVAPNTAAPAANYFDSIKVPGKPTEVATPRPIEPVGTAEQVVNSRADTLNRAAIERKLTEGLGNLPTHDRINMQDQAANAYDFVTSNKEEAMKVAMGDALPRPGLLPESVYTAFETKAFEEGDIETIRALSRSKIPTAAGQALKALDSVDPNNPVRIIRDIESALEAKVVKKKGGTVHAAEQAEVADIRKVAATERKTSRPTWDQFMETITCKS